MKVFSRCQKHLNKINVRYTWGRPSGYDTGIKVYNCITKKKEPLILEDRSCLTWYTCGPTVYDLTHLGHASCYIKLDIIQNILRKLFNINIVSVMNITDIDDKIINKSREKKVDALKLANHYEKLFLNDLTLLNIKEPDIIVRVSENVNIIIDFINDLINKGSAYKTSDNSVYFDVKNSCKTYGKLQNIGEDQNTKSNNFKRSPMDFALWKSRKSDDEPFWDSPWGPGRPGWHVECSALASNVFGSKIDVHAGGIDLRFPHHENEEALSCVFHDKSQWVNYWMHTGHLHLKESEKMSKSLKNTVSVEDLVKSNGVDGFRMLCAMTHYRSAMEYSEETLRTGENALKNFKNFIKTCDDYKSGYIKSDLNTDILKSALQSSNKNITEAICDDFNLPKVISNLNNLISVANEMIHSNSANITNSIVNKSQKSSIILISNFVTNILNTMNFKSVANTNINESSIENSSNILEIALEFRSSVRNKAIEEKSVEYLKYCDNFRNKLKESGISLRDYKNKSSFST